MLPAPYLVWCDVLQRSTFDISSDWTAKREIIVRSRSFLNVCLTLIYFKYVCVEPCLQSAAFKGTAWRFTARSNENSVSAQHLFIGKQKALVNFLPKPNLSMQMVRVHSPGPSPSWQTGGAPGGFQGKVLIVSVLVIVLEFGFRDYVANACAVEKFTNNVGSLLK